MLLRHRPGCRFSRLVLGQRREAAHDYQVGNYQQYLAKNPYRCHATTGIPFRTDS